MTTNTILHQESLTNPLGRSRTVTEWMKEQNINEVYMRFGAWTVTDWGVECLTMPYDIPANRLWHGEPDYPWTRHIAMKWWVSPPDFSSALDAAREFHREAAR